MLDATKSAFWASSSMNPTTLVNHGYDDVDLLGFLNTGIGRFKILDMVCVMGSFLNVNKNNIVEQLQSDACELGFQHMTDLDTANSIIKQKVEEDGEDKSEVAAVQSSECVNKAWR